MTYRILFAIHAPCDPRTAVFMNVTTRAGHLRSLGHTVDIIGPEALGASRFGGLAPLILGPLLLLRGRLSSYDIVVFHSHAGWGFHALRALIDRRGRVHTVTAFHGLEPLYHEMEELVLARHGRRYSPRFRLLHRVVLNHLLRFSCRRSHGVFCLNSTERAWLLEHRWCRPENLAMVANGVEKDFLPLLAPPQSVKRLLFLAQWLPRKGIRDLVEAFSSLAPANPDLQLMCVGTGQSAEVVKGQFPFSIRARVSVFPSVDRVELLALLQSADIFVFPSLFEGFSGALLEGMAAGLAVVATPAGAAKDLLEDRRNALVVPCADAAELARRVQELIDDAPLRARLGRAAQECASRYCWEAVNTEFAADLMAAYARPVPKRPDAS